MYVEKYLEELAGHETPISSAKLVYLSDLGPEEMALLTKTWACLSRERRRKLMTMLVTLAEGDVGLDFNVIFRSALTDPDGEVRATAILGLWECEEPSLIDPLIRLLTQDPDEKVRTAAARALGRFAILAETGKLPARDGSRISNALLRVVENGQETVEVRHRAMEAVAFMSIPQVEQVIRRAYASDDLKVKASALCAMGRTCDAKWLPVLLQELGHEDPEIRYKTVEALKELGEPESVPHLLPLLDDADPQVREAAIGALGGIGGPLAKRALTQARLRPARHSQELVDAVLQDVEFQEDPMRFPSGG